MSVFAKTVYTAWRPIETAPKDQHILVHWREPPFMGQYEIGWFSGDDGSWFFGFDSQIEVMEDPTHWMPLPEPPETERGG